MNLLRKEELKQGLKNMGLVYLLVISMVLAVFLVRMASERIGDSGGKIVARMESEVRPPYLQK